MAPIRGDGPLLSYRGTQTTHYSIAVRKLPKLGEYGLERGKHSSTLWHAGEFSALMIDC